MEFKMKFSQTKVGPNLHDKSTEEKKGSFLEPQDRQTEARVVQIPSLPEPPEAGGGKERLPPRAPGVVALLLSDLWCPDCKNSSLLFEASKFVETNSVTNIIQAFSCCCSLRLESFCVHHY